MGFTVHKSDTGAVPPNEYLPAAVGTYEVGQMLTMTDGVLAPLASATTTTPPYICQSKTEIKEAGEKLTVNRVSKDVIYLTSLSAASAAAVPGGRLRVSEGGKQVSTGAGTFEIVSIDGTAIDSAVRGRFV